MSSEQVPKGVEKELAELIARVRRETIEKCASIPEAMVIGGRAWTEEQAIAADALFAAAKNIRKLESGE